MIYYSKSTGCHYLPVRRAILEAEGLWPSDAVEVHDSEYDVMNLVADTPHAQITADAEQRRARLITLASNKLRELNPTPDPDATEPRKLTRTVQAAVKLWTEFLHNVEAIDPQNPPECWPEIPA